MAEIYDQNGQEQQIDPTYYEEEDGSLLSLITNNIVKIIIGLVIVILLIGGVIFFLSSRSNKTSTKSVTSTKPTPTRTVTTTPSQLPTSIQTKPTGVVSTTLKTYTDNTLKYTVSIPPNWESFKRAGNDIAYQTAFRPSGSSDVPITINVQPNTSNLSLEEIVAQMYPSSPKESKQVNGKPTYFVKNPGFSSYVLVQNGKIYEISGSTVGSYVDVFNQIVSSFKVL